MAKGTRPKRPCALVNPTCQLRWSSSSPTGVGEKRRPLRNTTRLSEFCMALRVRRVDESVKSLVWSKKRRETAPLAICKKPRFRNVNLAGGHKFFLSRPCLSALGGRNVRHDGNSEGGAMIDDKSELGHDGKMIVS